MKIFLSDNVNDPDYREKKAESVTELKELIVDITRWINTDIKIKEHKAHAEYYLRYLKFIVKHCPEESQAAVCGARAVWCMLFGDVWQSAGSRHLRKTLPGSATVDDVRREWDLLRTQQPSISKTKAAPMIARILECSTRTVWNRYREAKI